MAVKDLKLTQEEIRKEVPVEVAEDSRRDEYPYGLKITLTQEELKKLEMKANQFKLNEPLELLCSAQVVGMREDPGEAGESVTIQITGLDISKKEPTRFEGFHEQQVSGPGEGVTE